MMTPSFWSGSAWDKVCLHMGQWLVSSLLPRSPTSALGTVLPSQAGGTGVIHSWHCVLRLHSIVSLSISSASCLHQGQGPSDGPSLTTGHSNVTGSIAYLRPTSHYFPLQGRLVSVFYSIVTPSLNPVVYCLRNTDMQAALKKLLVPSK